MNNYLLIICLLLSLKLSAQKLECRSLVKVRIDTLWIVDGKKWTDTYSPFKVYTSAEIKSVTTLPFDDGIAIFGEEGRKGVMLITIKKSITH